LILGLSQTDDVAQQPGALKGPRSLNFDEVSNVPKDTKTPAIFGSLSAGAVGSAVREVRHGECKLINGADGSTDRVDVVAKYSL